MGGGLKALHRNEAACYEMSRTLSDMVGSCEPGNKTMGFKQAGKFLIK
jgi:hypothetical protein